MNPSPFVTRVAAAVALLAPLGCAGLHRPDRADRVRPSTAAAEAPEDVDAPFERRFEAGELELSPVEPPSARMAAQSARPFVDKALTGAGVEAAGADLLTADESATEDADAGSV